MENFFIFSTVLLTIAVVIKFLAIAGQSSINNMTLANNNFKIMVARVNIAKEKGFCDDQTEKTIKEELVKILNSQSMSVNDKVNSLKNMENKYPEVLSQILFI